MELKSLKHQLELKYYNNLDKSCIKSNLKDNYIKNKIKQLSSNNENIILTTETETNNDLNKIVYSEDYLYKRSWTKLSTVHKIIKIKEYINQLLIENQIEKKKLEKELVFLIKNKVLTKKDKVKYNSVKGHIYSIPDLIYKNGIYSIKIKK